MQSETIGKLAEALAKAQGEIKSAVKGKENPFFKSTYADLAAVMEACRAALSKNNIAVTQTTDFEPALPGSIPAVIWIVTTLMHSSGEWIIGKYLLNPIKNDPQSVGSAMTYGRRYALAAMVGVVAENEDDDGEGAHGRESPPKTIERKTTGAVPLKTPSPDEAKAAAIAFAKVAKTSLDNINSKSVLVEYMDNNKAKIDKIKDYDTDHAEIVRMAVEAAEKRSR